VPKASSEPLPEIARFLKRFAPLFRRSQSRQSLERYVTGLLTDLDRKNCDTIAAAVAATSTERLQHLLTDADWDSLKLDGARVRSLSQKSPQSGGILVLDDTSFPKQGKSSVGVAPQYCGALGKRANCQVVVSAEYVADEPESSRPLHWPVCAQLYLPESWAKDRERRERMCQRRCTLGANLRWRFVWWTSQESGVCHLGWWLQTPVTGNTLCSSRVWRIDSFLTYAGWRAPSGCACPRR
jgi:SRSO17 transposase